MTRTRWCGLLFSITKWVQIKIGTHPVDETLWLFLSKLAGLFKVIYLFFVFWITIHTLCSQKDIGGSFGNPKKWVCNIGTPLLRMHLTFFAVGFLWINCISKENCCIFAGPPKQAQQDQFMKQNHLNLFWGNNLSNIRLLGFVCVVFWVVKSTNAMVGILLYLIQHEY